MKKRFSLLAGVALAGALTLGSVIPANAYSAPNADVQKIFEDTNNARASNGLKPLVLNEQMTKVAQDWSATQAREGRMYHNPNYSTQIPGGWSRAAENVAYGYAVNSVVNGWMNSPGHKANILGDHTSIGIGVAKDANGRNYYTQVFGKYANVTPPTPQPPTPQPSGNLTTGDFSVQSHVQNIGWMNGGGTTGKSLRLEAMKVTQVKDKKVCLAAHVQNIGWQGKQCTNGKGSAITVGTTGKALRLEALTISSPDGGVSAEAHVQNIGWQGKRTAAKGADVTVGTSGQALRLEAVNLFQ